MKGGDSNDQDNLMYYHRKYHNKRAKRDLW